MYKEYTHPCRFCGQYNLVKLPEDADVDEVDDAAAAECSCSAGHYWRMRHRSAENMRAQIAQLYQLDQADARSQEDIATRSRAMPELLLMAVDAIEMGRINKMTISHGSTKTEVTISSKDVIKLNVKRATTESFEA